MGWASAVVGVRTVQCGGLVTDRRYRLSENHVLIGFVY